MQQNIPSSPLAATVAQHSADIDALDHGLVLVGQTADQAMARTERIEAMLSAVVSAAGLDDAEDPRSASFGDPVSARAQARKRRIEKSGFRLIAGGAS